MVTVYNALDEPLLSLVKMYFIIIIFIQLIASSLENDEYITVLTKRPVSTRIAEFQCYTPSTFSDYTLSYGRSFAISGGDDVNETTWTLRSDHRYPTYEKWNMGVYYCKIIIDGKTSIVQTIKFRSDAEITPSDKISITANIGDDVIISFDADPSWDVYWRKDNVVLSEETTKKKSRTFNSVKTTDAGIYEMYREGRRSLRLHSFINLIVRACPRHKWGPPDCLEDCEYCYNGGVCDDKTGICICAPGFMGTSCEIECGGNRHGWNCETRCTLVAETKEKCMKYQFCLPDPYGCGCVTGFKGIECTTPCESGKYGANCAQFCHCNQGECDQYTGNCTDAQDSSCAHPWTGSNCQECQQPYYGENCELKCTKSCDCHRITGECLGKCYTKAWLEPYCEIGIVETTFPSANNGQNTDVQCKVYDGGVVTAPPLVTVTANNGGTENITPSGATSDGQNITTYIFSVISDVNSTYKCVIFQGLFLAQSDIESNIFISPSYNGNMKTVSTSSSSITIGWTAWNNEADAADGPIEGYFLYYKKKNADNWESKQYHQSLSGTVTGLMRDTTYTFAVSAVRPGKGGEGPIGKQRLSAATLHGISIINVITGFGVGVGFTILICTIVIIGCNRRLKKKSRSTPEETANNTIYHTYATTNY